MAWSTRWAVAVDGQDLTDAFRPVLMDITVTDKDGTASDTCSLTIEDRDGRIVLPRDGVRLAVSLEGIRVFAGTVDTVRFELSRGGGRTLQVGAKGFDAKGKVKNGQSWHMDDAALGDVLDRAARKAGLAGITVDPALASIQRDYWSPDGETFLAWGARLAREHGATFKIRDGQAVFALRGSGLSPAGAALPIIRAAVGENLVSCSITPVTNRARFGRARVRFFDRETAAFRQKDVEIEEGVEAEDDVLSLAKDEPQADEMTRGRKAGSDRDSGAGRVDLTLTPAAQAEGTLVLVGTRPGIDGTYRITGVTHRADRSGGASTSLDLAQPQGDAGKDERKAGGGQAATRGGTGGAEDVGSTAATAAPEPSVRPSGNGFAGSPESSGRRRF